MGNVFWVLLLVNQLLLKMYYIYIIFEQTYTQFLVLPNKAMVSILMILTWWLMSTTYKLMLVTKGKLACVTLTTPPAHYHPPSLIYYNFFISVMTLQLWLGSWRRCSLVACSLWAPQLWLFKSSIRPKWSMSFLIQCLQYLMRGLYTQDAPSRTFSLHAKRFANPLYYCAAHRIHVRSYHSILFSFAHFQMGPIQAILEHRWCSYAYAMWIKWLCVSTYQQWLSPCSTSCLDDVRANLEYRWILVTDTISWGIDAFLLNMWAIIE